MSGALARAACMALGHDTEGAPDLLSGIPVAGAGAGVRRCARCGRYVATDSFGKSKALTEGQAYALRAAAWNFCWKEAGERCERNATGTA